MNVKETATAIVELTGGKENIAHLEHCSTRLRFTLKDNSLVQKDALEKSRWCDRCAPKCPMPSHHRQ